MRRTKWFLSCELMCSSNEKRNTFLTWSAFSAIHLDISNILNEGILNSLFLYWWAVLRLNFKKYDRERNTQESLNDYNKILTETDTEAFFFWNWKWHFLSETKFSETETDTFFRDLILWNQNREFFPETKFSETNTNWQKSRDWDQNRDFSMSLTIFGESKTCRSCVC